MVRKRQHDSSNSARLLGQGRPAPENQGTAFSGLSASPSLTAPTMIPGAPGAPAVLSIVALLLLSADPRRADELLRALERNVGKNRYTVAWVGTIQDLSRAIQQPGYGACFVDLASPEISRLAGNEYHLFGKLPYLAVLTTPSLSNGNALLQQLEANGYYGYVGYPFDGRAIHTVLTEIFQQLPPAAAPQPVLRPEEPRIPPTGPGLSFIPNQPTIYSQPSAPPPKNTASISPLDKPTQAQAPTQMVPPPVAPAAPAVPKPEEPPAAHAPVPLPYPMPTPPALVEPPSTGVATMPPSAVSTVPLMPAPPTAPSAPSGPVPFTIQPQLVQHRGLFVCWSPLDGAQRTAAALNLATALAFAGFRTLVGELRRPAGPLSSYLELTEEERSRSLLAAANASGRLSRQKGYVIDQELLENHLLNAIPLDPHNDKSPGVHFFLSGPAASPQLLFNAPALDPNQSPFLPELLQMTRQFWDFAFIVVGSNPVDQLHWQAFRACDRLLVFLPPDEVYLAQARQLLPSVMRAARIAPANVDVILTQADRGFLTEQMDPIMRLLAKHSQAEERQAPSLRGVLPGKSPQLEEKQLRSLEVQLRKVLANSALRGKTEEQVKATLRTCNLDDTLAGVLPDVLPLMRTLRRQNRLLLPLVMQRDFAMASYVLAIRDLLGAWIQMAASTPGSSRQR